MTAHSTAKGIASLGRYGDDVIVHMSREEVKGLQALAKANGTSLTINPHTGMPEAFKLGRIFKAVAPIAAGWALGPGGFGLFSSPLTAALAVGAGTGLLTGNLGQGLMAGLGAYGGFGLGDTFAKMGATTAGGLTPTMTANITQAATGAPLVGSSSQFISPFTPQGIAGGAGLGVGTVNSAGLAANSVGHVQNAILSNQVRNAALTGINPAFNAANNINAANVVSNTAPTSGFTKSGQGIKKLFTFGDETTPSGWQQFKNAAGTEIPATPDKIQNITIGDKTGTITTPGTPATIKPASDFQAIGKLGGPALAIAESTGVFDEPLYTTTPQGTRMKRVPTGTYDAQGRPEYKYVPAESYAPTETLNLNNPYENYGYMTPPPPLKLAASGGEVQSYATGGTIQSGGIRDLYGTPDNQPTISPGLSGFGLGRLNNLASEQALNQAQTLGYAMGGPVSFADGGNSNKEPIALPSLIPDANMIPSVAPTNTLTDSQIVAAMQALDPNQNQMPNQTNDSLIAKVAANLKADPNYKPVNPVEEAIVKQMRGDNNMQVANTSTQDSGSTTSSYPTAASYNPSTAIGPTYYAGLNAPRSRGYAIGGDVGMDLNSIPSLNVNFVNKPKEDPKNSSPVNPIANIFGGLFRGSFGIGQGYSPNMGMPGGVNTGYNNSNPGLLGLLGLLRGVIPSLTPKEYALNVNTGKQEPQYAQGGYLDGAGDGMSDSIPATIEGKQPARLADGEFVIPADVVSHLGNGSTKAGSKRLYAMLDKVRHARTGTKKQGRQIKAEKYLPA